MTSPVLIGSLALMLVAQPPPEAADAQALFDRGVTFQVFLGQADAQREQWRATAARAAVAGAAVAKARAHAAGLAMLVVAEDWCPDSVNVVPYVARLAEAASIPLRIVHRDAGAAVMRRHPAPDGRPVTPTIVLLRNGRDSGAWVERPAIVQQWFLSMAASPENARRFEQRQSWYDADQGRTVIAEMTELIERVSSAK